MLNFFINLEIPKLNLKFNNITKKKTFEVLAILN